jgi:hypothetical protein
MSEPKLESWQRNWRMHIAPQLSTSGLNALAQALKNDDPRLLQSETFRMNNDRQLSAACVIGFCGWQGDQLQTTADVTDYFRRVSAGSYGKETALPYSAFLSWYDHVGRPTMLALLLPEVELVLEARKQALQNPVQTSALA